MTSRRAALVPFSLSDGTKVRPGDWVCAPMQAMMYDPELYPDPEAFHAFRFVDPKKLPQNAQPQPIQPEGESKFTDPSYKWGMWGNFRTAWYVIPGSSFSLSKSFVVIQIADIQTTDD